MNLNATERRAAFSLAFVYVLRMLGLFMVMPVLVVFASRFPDYTALMAGIAVGAYGLTQAALQIPMGLLSDRIGRKPVIVAGLLLFTIGSIIAGYAESMGELIVGRLLQGAGAIAGAIMALAADVSREKSRPVVMAIIGIAIGFSFYVAVLLGPIIASAWGLSGIFFATAALAITCLPLVIFVVPSAQNRAPSGDTLPNWRDVGRLMSDHQLVRLNVSVLCLHFLITLLFTQLPWLLSDLAIEFDRQWTLYLPVLVGSVIGLGVLMRISTFVAQQRVLVFSIILMASAFAMLVLTDKTTSVVIAFAMVFFTGFNYLEANLPVLVSNTAPAGKKGSAMGAYASFQFLGAFLGGTISGLLTSSFAPEVVYIVASTVCIGWLLLIAGLQGTDKLKRYTLSVNFTQHPAEYVGDTLAQVAGVKDITLVPSEQTVYLKVDGSVFDIQAAKQALQTE